MNERPTKRRGPIGLIGIMLDGFRDDPVKGLAVFFGLLALYVILLGPACWISQRTGLGTSVIEVVYWPVLYFALEDDPDAFPEKPLRSLLRSWMSYGAESGMRPVRKQWALKWRSIPPNP